MDQDIVAFAVLAGLAVIVPGSILVLSYFAGPARRRVKTDLTPYECGIKPFESARRRFSVKFYIVAMLFIIFDVEAVFLFPFASVFGSAVKTSPELAWHMFWVMTVFLVVLTVGFLYEWGRGALEWD